MFKTLAGLFMAQDPTPAPSEAQEETTEQEVITEEAVATTNEDPAESPLTDSSDRPNGGTEEATQEASLPAQPQISVDRYNALVALEAEMAQFGDTPAARASFLAEAKQLHAWYENVKSINITPQADASAAGKQVGKKVSAITAEAIAMQEKLVK